MMGTDSDERPDRFTPAWPPRHGQKPLPNIFTRCSDKFKKVTWPPSGYEEDKVIEPPPTNVPLLEDMPLNPTRWTPTGTYKASPTVYAEEPEDLETEWPPPEPIDTSEKVIYDAARPKKVIRDFTVHFKGGEQPQDASYKVPPGTLHVLSKRGVLSYNTPELGSGRPKDPSQKI